MSRCVPQTTIPAKPLACASRYGEIADTAFIGAIVVVDYQHIARIRRLHCLEKNIDTAEMPNRKSTSRYFHSRCNRHDPTGAIR